MPAILRKSVLIITPSGGRRLGLVIPRGLKRFLARLCKDLNGIAYGEKFHGHVAIVFQLGEFLVNVDVVDLSAPGLVTAGNVSDMHQSNLIEVSFKIGNQVASGN